MQCLGCQYDLDGLSCRTCPECGRAFDPDDPATFGPVPRSTFPVVAGMASAVWPFAVTLWMFAAYVVGRFQLGRWPETGGLDDPKSIPVVRVMHTIWTIVFPTVVPSIAAAFFASAIVAMRDRRPRAAACIVGLGIFSWGATLGVCRWIDVWEWFFD